MYIKYYYIYASDVTTELWISDGSSSQNWRTVDFTFQKEGPFQLIWTGKRLLKNGVFGGGDIALDDIRVSECTDGEGATTDAPQPGEFC